MAFFASKKNFKFPKRQIREASILATASSIGLSFVFAILLGALAGHYLDKFLDSRPVGFISGLIIGIVAGFRNLFVLAARLDRAQAEAKAELERERKVERDREALAALVAESQRLVAGEDLAENGQKAASGDTADKDRKV